MAFTDDQRKVLRQYSKDVNSIKSSCSDILDIFDSGAKLSNAKAEYFSAVTTMKKIKKIAFIITVAIIVCHYVGVI